MQGALARADTGKLPFLSEAPLVGAYDIAHGVHGQCPSLRDFPRRKYQWDHGGDRSLESLYDVAEALFPQVLALLPRRRPRHVPTPSDPRAQVTDQEKHYRGLPEVFSCRRNPI